MAGSVFGKIAERVALADHDLVAKVQQTGAHGVHTAAGGGSRRADHLARAFRDVYKRQDAAFGFGGTGGSCAACSGCGSSPDRLNVSSNSSSYKSIVQMCIRDRVYL